MNKSRVTQWLGIGISLLAVLLLLRALPINKVADALAHANYWWLIPAIAVSLLSFVFRGQRFRLLLRTIRHFSLWRAYAYIAINYMGNNVLPARAGEVLLSVVVRQQEEIPVSSSLAVTVLGRVVDGLLLLLVLLGAVFFLPFPVWIDQVLVIGLTIFGLALMLLLWVVFGREEHHRKAHGLLVRWLPDRLERWVELAGRQMKHFQSGLMSLKSPHVVWSVVILSIAIWLCEGSVYLLVGHAAGISQTLVEWLFVLALANLAATIPSGPASVGTFEGVVIVALGLSGVPWHQAAAYALLLHATQVIPVTLIGAGSYLRMTVGSR